MLKFSQQPNRTIRKFILLKKLEIKAVKFESKEETNEELGSWT